MANNGECNRSAKEVKRDSSINDFAPVKPQNQMAAQAFEPAFLSISWRTEGNTSAGMTLKSPFQRMSYC